MERVFITVSSKGQMVIPAAIREELGIKRLRKKAETGVKCLKSIPQGLKCLRENAVCPVAWRYSS
jgi:hypothetical protein